MVRIKRQLIFLLCITNAVPSPANLMNYETLSQLKKWLNAAGYVDLIYENVFADQNAKLQAKLEAQEGYKFENRCLDQAKEYCNNIKMTSFKWPQNQEERYDFGLNLKRCKAANKCAADRIEQQFNEQKEMAGHTALASILKYTVAGFATRAFKSFTITFLDDYSFGRHLMDIFANYWSGFGGLAGGAVVFQQYDQWIKSIDWLRGKRNEILEQVRANGVEIEGGEYIFKKWDEIIEEYVEKHELIE